MPGRRIATKRISAEILNFPPAMQISTRHPDGRWKTHRELMAEIDSHRVAICGSISAAARTLGIARYTLQRRLKKRRVPAKPSQQ